MKAYNITLTRKFRDEWRVVYSRQRSLSHPDPLNAHTKTVSRAVL